MINRGRLVALAAAGLMGGLTLMPHAARQVSSASVAAVGAGGAERVTAEKARAERVAAAERQKALLRTAAIRGYGLTPHVPMRRSLYTYHDASGGINDHRRNKYSRKP